MTIIARHLCLADGTRKSGDCLDCPDCRDALIKSFGEPVGDNSTETSHGAPPVVPQPGDFEQEIDPDPVKRCAYCGFPPHEGRCGFCLYDNSQEEW